MKSIQNVITEINNQLSEGTNGYEDNIASVDLNGEYSLFVELDQDGWCIIELIHSESSDILENTDAKYNNNDMQVEIERLINNNIVAYK